MKLVRYGNIGTEKPGIVDNDGKIYDVSSIVIDWNADTIASPALLSYITSQPITQFPLVTKAVRLGACVYNPGKVICIGFNSKQHAKEMGVTTPATTDMVIFMKPTCAVCGPQDPILYTPYTKKLDWEAELGIVIGKKGKYIDESTAKDYILGYTCINDLSQRYWQLETADKQFTKGKCFDNAAPIGPYIVTKDEIVDANNLQIQLLVNDIMRQNFNSNEYIHNDVNIISYVSRFFTLYPGDIISMGSGPGSAKSWGDDCFLKPGDKVTLIIDGLGQQEQKVAIE